MRNKKGFTLVELMVVVVIIGILATLGFSRYRTLTLKAKIREAAIYLKYLWELEGTYYIETGMLPHQDGTLIFISDADPAHGWGHTPWWQSLSERARNRLKEMGVDYPSKSARFWYLFSFWGGGATATRIIYAYPKSRSTFFAWPEDEIDQSLRNITLAIDNDGIIYVWGVPGMGSYQLQ